MVGNCDNSYKCLKWWHKPWQMVQGDVMCWAYSYYLECAEGKLDPVWKIAKPVDFRTFRDATSVAMLNYDPASVRYIGDEAARVVTKLPKAKRTKLVVGFEAKLAAASGERGS